MESGEEKLTGRLVNSVTVKLHRLQNPIFDLISLTCITAGYP